MPLSISNVSIWEQIYNGVTKRSLIAKKLKHLVSIYPEVLHFTFSYQMEGVVILATPSVVIQAYSPIHDKREKKDISIITALHTH